MVSGTVKAAFPARTQPGEALAYTLQIGGALVKLLDQAVMDHQGIASIINRALGPMGDEAEQERALCQSPTQYWELLNVLHRAARAAFKTRSDRYNRWSHRELLIAQAVVML